MGRRGKTSLLTNFDSFFLYIFWSFVGASIAAPFLFLKSAWQAARTSDHYHFRGFNRLKKEYHQRDARRYGSLMMLSIILVVGFFVVL